MDPTTHPRYKDARRHAPNVRGFYIHALVYVLVTGGLLAVNYASGVARFWAVWPVLGWGIGVLAHGLSVFAGSGLFGTEWEERKIREYLERRP